MIVALAAPARRQVELQRRRLAHERDGRLDRRLGEDGAAEIGVQHRAGKVEQRAQVGAVFRIQACKRQQRQLLRAGDGGRQFAAHPRFINRGANGAGGRHAAETFEQRGRCSSTKNGIDRRQLTQTGGSRTFHFRLIPPTGSNHAASGGNCHKADLTF